MINIMVKKCERKWGNVGRVAINEENLLNYLKTVVNCDSKTQKVQLTK